MIDLVRGNINNLEGKVIAYSKIIGSNELSDENSIIAVYSTDDIDDFAEKFPISKDTKEKLRNEGRKLRNEEKKNLNLDINNTREKEYFIQPFYTARIIFENEELMMDFGHDLVYSGDFHYKQSCDHANFSAVDFYQIRYTEQKILGRQNKQNIEFSNSTNGNIKSYINKKYVNPMIECVAGQNAKNTTHFETLKDQFLEFAAGKIFDEDVLELSDIISTYGRLQDYNLISAYVDKIDALSREDFVLAAEMRDKIKKIMKIKK